MSLRPTQIAAIQAILENRPVVFRCDFVGGRALPGNGAYIAEGVCEDGRGIECADRATGTALPDAAPSETDARINVGQIYSDPELRALAERNAERLETARRDKLLAETDALLKRSAEVMQRAIDATDLTKTKIEHLRREVDDMKSKLAATAESARRGLRT